MNRRIVEQRPLGRQVDNRRSPHLIRRSPLVSTDVIQGTLDMLILKSLSLAPMHGFGVTKRIEQISKGVFKVNPGSLLLAFQRMERDGLIDSEWRASDNNRRAKYYTLTSKGRRRLKAETSDWERRAAAIARLLEA
jgi:transcriptional regulator